MMTAADYERLLKLIKLLGSTNDGEVLNAVTAASRLLNQHGLAWDDLILPRKLLPARARAVDPMVSAAAPQGPIPLSQATPQNMYDALLDSPNLSPSIRRDILGYRGAIADGRVSAEMRADLRSLYHHVILQGRAM
ncbi:MAG: hypothetical protein ACPGVX_09665 [Thalassobaculaceae bacterium]